VIFPFQYSVSKECTRSVVLNQGCSHPPEVRDIIPRNARSVRLSDGKFIYFLLSCGYFFVSFCSGL